MKVVFRLLVLLCIGSSLVHAQVPQLLEYDGFLPGNISGNRTIGVRLYNASTNGTLLYKETIGTVKVTQGQFYFQYGQNGTLGNGTTPMNLSSCLTGNQNWLAITINGTEQTPRERLLAVPFALRSADGQSLRDELVAAGLLKPTPPPSDPTFVFCVNSAAYKNTVQLQDNKLAFYTDNLALRSFETFIKQRLALNDRILTFNYDLLKEAKNVSNYLNRTKIPLNYINGSGEPTGANLVFYIAIPQNQGILKTFRQNGFTVTVGGVFSQSRNFNQTLLPIKYNGIMYNVYRLNNPKSPTKSEIYLDPPQS